MRKIKLQMAFAAEGWDMDATKFSIDNLDKVDTILLGRVTAEGFIPYWLDVANNPVPDDVNTPMGKPLTAIPKLIFSNTVSDNQWQNAKIIGGEIVRTISELKKKDGEDIMVYGGNTFATNLIENNLIDEYYFIINPLSFEGDALLKKVKELPNVILQESKTLNGRIVVLKYLKN